MMLQRDNHDITLLTPPLNVSLVYDMSGYNTKAHYAAPVLIYRTIYESFQIIYSDQRFYYRPSHSSTVSPLHGDLLCSCLRLTTS